MDKRKDGGYIKLSRSILEWKWFNDDKTYRLFTTLLCLANWKPSSRKDRVIQRGQLVTTTEELAKRLGYSKRSVITGLNNLRSTGEIVTEKYHRETLITIPKYEIYQDGEVQKGNGKKSFKCKKGTHEVQKGNASEDENAVVSMVKGSPNNIKESIYKTVCILNGISEDPKTAAARQRALDKVEGWLKEDKS